MAVVFDVVGSQVTSGGPGCFHVASYNQSHVDHETHAWDAHIVEGGLPRDPRCTEGNHKLVFNFVLLGACAWVGQCLQEAAQSTPLCRRTRLWQPHGEGRR